MQVNGGMSVSQENGGSNVIVSNATVVTKYIIDGFVASINHPTGIISSVQGGELPMGGGIALPNYLGMTATTALTSLTASNYFALFQRIEGYRVARLAWGGANAQPITIGFWVMATIPGHMTLAIRNTPPNRTYAVDITINGAMTWEYKTVTIPGDTTGAWEKTTLSGIEIWLAFAAASGWNTPTPGAWAAGNFLSTAAQTNFCATANNSMFVGNLTVLPGLEAPSAARSPFIMRSFDQELATCMRYWEKGDEWITYYSGAGIAGIATAYGTMPFAVVKRAAPTMSYNNWVYYTTADANPGVTLTLYRSTPTLLMFQATSMTNWKAWYPAGTWIADARI